MKIEKFLATLQKHSGPQRANRYDVFLPEFPGFETAGEELNNLCRSVQVPGKDINVIERKINPLTSESAGGYDINNISLQFTETADSYVFRYFENWLNLIVDPETKLSGYKNDYAKDIRIRNKYDVAVQYDLETGGVKDKTTRNRELILTRCWPRTRPEITYSDKERDSIIEITIELSVTDYKVKYV